MSMFWLLRERIIPSFRINLTKQFISRRTLFSLISYFLFCLLIFSQTSFKFGSVDANKGIKIFLTIKITRWHQVINIPLIVA